MVCKNTSLKNYFLIRMKQITNFIRKIPKPYQHNIHQPHRIVRKNVSWQYYIIFCIFYLFGMNVFFTKNLFVMSLLIKLAWIIFLIVTLNQTIFTFAEGFIFYTICMTYVFHFFDIFLLFFFVIFIPNGQRLLEE